MTYETLEKEVMKEFDTLWYKEEHDSIHFYEFKSFISKVLLRAYEAGKDEILNKLNR